MNTGQTFQMASTKAVFTVEETSADGRRGIAAGLRTGARILVIETIDDGYFAREVTDNGENGSLLDTLIPHGARYRVRPVPR
jgi:hypothetical protein